MHPSFNQVYSFNSERENDEPQPLDAKIGYTIAYILKRFFQNEEHAMIMEADTSDGKEQKRLLRFDRWFDEYNDGSVIKYSGKVQTDDYNLYISLYVNRNNEEIDDLVTAFQELVSNQDEIF
jgi:hypothetical protein